MQPFSLVSRLIWPVAMMAGLPASCDVAPELMAKFIKVIATNCGSPGRLDIQDPTLVKALGNLGVSVDKSSKVAYATSEAEVKTLKAAGKLVVCNRLDLLPLGGSIAIVEEDSKAVVYLHTGHISASGAQVSPAILRLGRQDR